MIAEANDDNLRSHVLTHTILALDDADLKRRLRSVLTADPNVHVRSISGTSPAWSQVLKKAGDLLLLSRSIIPDTPKESLAALRQVPDAPDVIVLAPSDEDSEERAALLAAGCYAVLDSTLPVELLGDALQAIIARHREKSVASLTPPQQLDAPLLSDFLSDSAAMHTFLEVVRRVVHFDATLLINGETGVGKERLAQAIHEEGPRARGPFIAVNCGAIPEALLESELFGHMEGSFTGATRSRRGWFELAHGGTILLDEIGEMPPHLQVKLLRVLQSREIVPVGSEKPTKLDVRVMAATNRNLEDEMANATFRSDLYYRLSVVTLTIPPLRERKEDIPTLVDRYVKYFQTRMATTVQVVSEDALAALVNYSWPGNIRELVNVIERAALLCTGDTIELRDLPGVIRAMARDIAVPQDVWSPDKKLPVEWLERPLRQVRNQRVEQLEKAYLVGVLQACRGRIDDTAKRAGMNPRNLFEKMRKYGLNKEEFRPDAKQKPSDFSC